MSKRKWGRVDARPSEYVIKLRAGRVVEHGPGLNTYVWPWNSCALVPTTIQRVSFVADQVTAEKVGVEVRGIAVFRVADPLLTFRVLELDNEGGMTRVCEILRDMFVGAARRLVANMTIDDCLTRRKEAIATELIREIAPVVSGTGRPDDPADAGWGLVIDTIEIQDVRILSETVFENLQAPYRAAIETKARESAVQRDREGHLREVEAAQRTHAADLELQRERADAEQNARLRSVERNERFQLAELEAHKKVAAMQHDAELARLDRVAAVERAEFEMEASLQRERAEAERALLDSRLEVVRKEAELQLELDLSRRRIENEVSPERIELELVTRALPALASAMIESATDVRVVQMGGAADSWPTGIVAQILGLREAVGMLTRPTSSE